MNRVQACVAGWLVACGALHAQAVSFETFGPSPGAAFGNALAVVGDVNGDGFPDLAVGAPFDIAGFSSVPTDGFTGSVTLVSGLDGAVLVSVAGVQESELFGWSVAAAGDVDGDGGPDVLVGAPNWNAFRGRVVVLSGSGEVLLTVTGNSAGDRFGWAVAPLGDLNGDGHADFAAGAWNDSVNLEGQGVATAISGANGQTLALWKGLEPFDHFGSALANVGDVDLDGVPDLAVGGELMNAGSQDAGGVIVESGATGAPLKSWFGNVFSDRFGHAVAGPGDATGDGVPDVLVGAPGAFSQTGRVYLYSGADSSLALTVVPALPAGNLGTSVSGVGDLDGDGRADFAVGAPLVGVPLAGGPGQAWVVSSAGGAVLLQLDGELPLGGCGSAVAGADFDADGFPDLAVGLPFEGGGPVATGKVTVLSGDDWINIGVGVLGTEGVPQMLAQGAASPGQTVSFSLQEALAGAPAVLIVGLSEFDKPFKSGTLVPHPDWLSPIVFVGTGGSVTLAGTWPAGVPAGTPFWFQWWLADPAAPLGWAGTSGVKIVVQ